MKLARVDEVEPSAAYGARWIPLRVELGIAAFGLSAYVGDRRDVVVPRHQETGGGAGGP